MRIVFAGTPAFAVPALRALLSSPHTVAGVLTQPDRPKGRGRQLSASPVKELALSAGVPVAQPVKLATEEERAPLIAWAPEVLVVVAYGLLVPSEVLAVPPLGCVNIHPSLLPRWRGAAPIQRTVLAGDAETGVTIMQMDKGLDTGPILLQERTPLALTESSAALHERLAVLGAQALLTALGRLAAGTLPPIPQPQEGVTYAAKLEKSDAPIDWRRPATQICRQVHAFNGWPVAETRLMGEQLRIFDAHVLPGAGEPGVIVSAGEAIVVQCGEDRLALTSVQRPGRKVMAARDLANALQLTGQRLG